MSAMDERWADEEAWWTMGSAEARRRMHPSCILAQDGLMQGDEILAALDRTPRWDSVAMTGRRMSESADCVVLAYRATARRADGRQASALCTSTWLRHGDDWLLVQHQRCAVPDGG